MAAEQWNEFNNKERTAFLSNYRLAYRKPSVVNCNLVDKTVLANEEVVDGGGPRSERWSRKRYYSSGSFASPCTANA